MENQTLTAINHTKYASKKKDGPVKICNYLQDNGATNYDYDSIVNKIQELMENWIINQSYKKLIQKVVRYEGVYPTPNHT